MQTGISLYPGLDNTLEQNMELLKKAKNYGISRIFTSLHIPETNQTLFKKELRDLLLQAHILQLDVVCDVSPQACTLLGLKKLDPIELQKIGITTIRCDYGFSIDKIALFSTIMQVQLNASTLTHDTLTALQAANADFSHMDALHNFYPRPYTGLSERYFCSQNNYLREKGISVGAFIPSCSSSGRRGPLYEGLPTLEAHRNISVSLAARHLTALDTDSIFIGDSHPTDEELSALTQTQKNVVVLKARLLSHDPFVRDFLSHSFTARQDPSRDAVRAQESRNLLHGHSIQPDATTILDKRLGDITIDNKDYKRYMGEVQIITTEQPSNERTNIAARIIPNELFLIKYITPGRQFRFEFIR